jgi:hypothetical protein
LRGMIPKSGFWFSDKIMPSKMALIRKSFLPPEQPATTIG